MFFRSPVIAACLASIFPFAALPEEDREVFVESNILAIFYHELGHAVIDLTQVPIFGQEEDAADVMAVLLIDWLFEEDTAQAIAYDSAFGYLSDPDEAGKIAWWDLHGPDEQRFYNHVCLFCGGNPEERGDLAHDLGLPEERADTCPEEYDLAADSWGMIFDEMDSQGQGVPMAFLPGRTEGSAIANEVLRVEVVRLSQDIALPAQIEVRVDSCGEANAIYDPGDRSIIFCAEFVGYLQELYDTAVE